VRKGRTHALLNKYASKKRKLDGGAAADQKEVYEQHIADFERQLQQLQAHFVGNQGDNLTGFKK
jgi:hypothetical protein